MSWRKTLLWQSFPSIETLLDVVNNVPKPTQSVIPLQESYKQTLEEYGFHDPTKIKNNWVYQLFEKIKQGENSQLLLTEIGFTRIKFALSKGLLNLNEEVLTLSSKGEELYNIIQTQLLPNQNTTKYTQKYFEKIKSMLENSLVNAQATDLIDFWAVSKTSYGTKYYGEVSKKFISYIIKIENSFKQNLGANMGNVLYYDQYDETTWSPEEISIDIVQNFLWSHKTDNVVLEYLHSLYPRRQISFVVLESENILAGHIH